LRRSQKVSSPFTTKAAILQALAIEPGYGTLIIQKMQNKGIKLHVGSVYPALIKLEDEGLAREKRATKNQKPGVVTYELTAKGKRTVTEHRTIIKSILAGPEAT
jgi:DNA-binding PadR family transcriptional regulator